MKLALGAAIGVAALIAALGADGGTNAVPPGFAPDVISAVGPNGIWALGTAPCGAARCAALVRTTDGGGSFERLTPPPLRREPYLIRLVWFANRRDGFASVIGGGSYATHDGARSWRRLRIGTLFSVAADGGRAFAVTADCRNGCRRFRLRTARVSGGDWRLVRLGFAPVAATAEGANVWVLGSAWRTDRLARSRDRGRTFATGNAPCDSALSGQLAPTSGRALWLVCATGTNAIAWRSTDRGVTFRPLAIPACCYHAVNLAAVSDRVAVAARNVAGRGPLRTVDGGRTWRATRTPNASAYWRWMAFTGADVGVALVAPRSTGPLEVWRTTDGGAAWRRVTIR